MQLIFQSKFILLIKIKNKFTILFIHLFSDVPWIFQFFNGGGELN